MQARIFGDNIATCFTKNKFKGVVTDLSSNGKYTIYVAGTRGSTRTRTKYVAAVDFEENGQKQTQIIPITDTKKISVNKEVIVCHTRWSYIIKSLIPGDVFVSFLKMLFFAVFAIMFGIGSFGFASEAFGKSL